MGIRKYFFFVKYFTFFNLFFLDPFLFCNINKNIIIGSFFENKIFINSKKQLCIVNKYLNLSVGFLNALFQSFCLGWFVELVVRGRGFRLFGVNGVLKIDLGFSHAIFYKIPLGIQIFMIKQRLFLFSTIKSLLMEFCIILRTLRVFNAYHIKGICFKTEKFRLKVGKKR